MGRRLSMLHTHSKTPLCVFMKGMNNTLQLHLPYLACAYCSTVYCTRRPFPMWRSSWVCNHLGRLDLEGVQLAMCGFSTRQGLSGGHTEVHCSSIRFWVAAIRNLLHLRLPPHLLLLTT